ncbi:MAG: aspartate aminotransferase family protein [Verrucomicrobiia bacterium]
MTFKEKTKEILTLLRKYESRNITYISSDGTFPIIWERARGVYVTDIEGKKYIDLTAAFGVAAAGHSNKNVIRAAKIQMQKLSHAMGDVHPHRLKAVLCERLSRLTFERWTDGSECGKTIFCNSGFESVEAALKTAILATGRRDIIAFEGAYHGLGYGALNATFRDYFKKPFLPQLGLFARFAPFPATEQEFVSAKKQIHNLFKKYNPGAVLVEPVQGRGGIRLSHPEFLPFLRKICDEYGALLILDEIYTGFGRTGKWFACEHFNVVPDIICLGKALTGGFPLSVCIGKGELMDNAWEESRGEAIHTSTFLGNPVGCAMALANIKEIEEKGLVKNSELLGKKLLQKLQSLKTPINKFILHSRGIGLMAGVEILYAGNNLPAGEAVLNIVKEMLKRGYIMIPEGDSGNVISFTPPLVIKWKHLSNAVEELQDVINKVLV